MRDTQPVRVRFGFFELDLKSGDLRNGDERTLLQEQPLQVLRMLVERDGELVTRPEIKGKLWPNDTIVEFDHSINTVIRNLRRTLGDSADAAGACSRFWRKIRRITAADPMPPTAARILIRRRSSDLRSSSMMTKRNSTITAPA